MTTRSVPQRLAAWLMVALLALIVGEPLRAHYCPMHDGAALMLLGAGAATGATTGDTHGASHETSHAASSGTTSSGTTSHDRTPGATDAAHGGGAHGGGAHGAGARGTGGDAAAPGEHSPAPTPHSCQCLGACCLTTPVSAPEPGLALAVTTTLAATMVVAPAVPVAVPGTADVVLPFAIGPPQAV